MTARRSRTTFAFCTWLLAALPFAAQASDDGTADAALTATIAALDTKLFDTYNRCDMATFSTLFAPDVEFFHDKGGVTTDRETVVENTRKNICGKVRRELVPGTLKVYPVSGYGAIEEGEHRFCQLAGGQCEGAAKFLMIWQQRDAGWVLTRIVSYAHRPLTDAEKAALAKGEGPRTSSSGAAR